MAAGHETVIRSYGMHIYARVYHEV